MKHRHIIMGLCSLLALGLGVNQASALTLDTSGLVTDWGVTPFSNTIPSAITGVNGNDTSPIKYPHGVGYQPSPGGTTGERFDLEGFYAYRDGTQVNVLLVTSSYFKAKGGNSTFNLGDLLIDVDHTGTFDLGVVTQSDNHGLDAGGVYDIDHTSGLQNKSGSYIHYAPVADAIGAWAIKDGTKLSQGSLTTATFDYGGKENGTWLYQYTFTLDQELQYHDLYMQMAWGCGNDMISLTLAGDNHPDGPPSNPPLERSTPTPEPASAILGLLSIGGVLLASRRRWSQPV